MLQILKKLKQGRKKEKKFKERVKTNQKTLESKCRALE